MVMHSSQQLSLVGSLVALNPTIHPPERDVGCYAGLSKEVDMLSHDEDYTVPIPINPRYNSSNPIDCRTAKWYMSSAGAAVLSLGQQ
jgi:hypothetical protein